jgi:hypothetical protein
MPSIRRGFIAGAGFGVALFGVFLSSGCSGGGGGGGMPTATPPPPVVVSKTFPANVAVAAGGGTAWDIVGVKTTLTGQFASAGGNVYDTLRVDVTFSQDVSNALPAPGQPLSLLTQLGVSIAIDSDGNPKTGGFETCNTSSPLLPFEYTTDQGNDPSRLSDGNYTIIGPSGPIYSGSPNPAAEAAVTLNGNTLSESFFLPSIDVAQGSKTPKIGLNVASVNGAAVNGFASGLTDCVPSDGSEIYTDGS